jgi:Flp pilus assembly protein TadG
LLPAPKQPALSDDTVAEIGANVHRFAWVVPQFGHDPAASRLGPIVFGPVLPPFPAKEVKMLIRPECHHPCRPTGAGTAAAKCRSKRPRRRPSARLQRLQTSLHRFGRDEDGSLLIFGVYIFIMILMVGGIGIDLMRFERDRAELQYTLDRAVLAAADLDQTLDPSTVVTDYMNKAGLSGYLSSVTVDEGLSYRVVSATARADLQTQFMQLSGVKTLSIPASSTAEERIGGVEISLVLDVSGSMNSNSKLANLKTAAKAFVDTMLDNTQDGKLSISIIPYATQVSAPADFLAEFNVSTEQTYSNCVNFQSADFGSTGITTTQALERTLHFSVWSNSDGRGNTPASLVSSPVCEVRADREMLILQKDRVALKTFIDNLSAGGNTSIDVGMKWGTALLDPSLNGVVNTMITNGSVPIDFTARPYSYTSGETLKIIVLMTDGQNTSQYYINNAYRSGNSDVWWNEATQRYSIYYAGYNSWYWPFSGQWADHPYGQDGYGCIYSYYYGWQCADRTETGSSVQLTFPELWAYTSLQYNVNYNMRPWMGSSNAWNTWYYGVRNYVGATTKNARTKTICDAAKAQQVTVFTIGFEAPSSGRAVLQDCASSASHYYDVAGLEIADAFSSIASSIRKLRLTQ